MQHNLEAVMPNLSWWRVLVADPVPGNIVKHLDFLCETEVCKTILEQVALLVTSIEIGKNVYREAPELRFSITFNAGDDNRTEQLVIEAPEDVDPGVPPSFAAILKIVGSISVNLYDSSGISLSSCNDQDWEHWENWFEEYAPEFLGTKVIPVVSQGSDQFVFHPILKRSNGEPQIVWLAHDGGGYETIPEPDLGAGGVFMRVLSERFLKPDGAEKEWFV
jgi:hypothetical protein